MAINISTIRIKAEPKKVWDALTIPEFVKKWQYGSNLITDWEVGKEIIFETEWEGKVLKQWGKILEINPNKSIKYSLFAPGLGLEDKHQNYFIMNYVLTDEGNGFTNLEIIKEDNRLNAVIEETLEDNPMLNKLKFLVEK